MLDLLVRVIGEKNLSFFVQMFLGLLSENNKRIKKNDTFIGKKKTNGQGYVNRMKIRKKKDGQ